MSATPGGQRDGWASMRARREQLERDATAFIEAIEAVYARDPAGQLASAVAAAIGRPERRQPDPLKMIEDGKRRLAGIGARPRGQFPDGTPVPPEFKRAVWEDYERLKAEHRGGTRRPQRPVLNSMGGPSELMRQLYELD